MGYGTGYLTGPDDEPKKSGERLVGIHSEEKLPCGCILKRWISGLNVIDDPACEYHRHNRYRKYICGICGKETQGLGTMRQHKKEHAI